MKRGIVIMELGGSGNTEHRQIIIDGDTDNIRTSIDERGRLIIDVVGAWEFDDLVNGIAHEAQRLKTETMCRIIANESIRIWESDEIQLGRSDRKGLIMDLIERELTDA